MIASLRLVILILAALLAASPAASEVQPERRVALVIGNSRYQHAPALANPASDARAVSEAFRRLGLDVTEGYDLGEKDMRALLVQFAERMAGAKGAIVFYAGHGVALDGVNYMLPVDIDLKSPADLDLNGVSVDLVLRQMRRDDRVNVIILDACRDNPFAAALSRSVVRAAVSSRGLQPIGGDLARGALIAFSTEPGATAFDGPAGAHSPFSAALLRHIEDPATPIEGVMSKVRAEVFAATASKQLPWVNTSIVGDFELNPAPKPPAAVAPTGENLLWQSAERSGAREDYQTYLDAFPEGLFAPLARRRVEATRLAPGEAEERALALAATDRSRARKALKLGGGDGFDESFRAGLRDWQKRHGYAATGYLAAGQLARLTDEAPPPRAAAAPPPKPPAKAAAAVSPPPAAAPKPPRRAVALAPKPQEPPPPARRLRREATPPAPARARQASAYAAETEPPPAPSFSPLSAHLMSPGGGSGGGGGGGGGSGGGGWSDIRLKRDVCRVGASPSGVPVYTFRYLWSDEWYRGAMAQDLLRLKPEAVHRVGDYFQVDYGTIDVRFEKIAKPAPCAV